MHDLYLCGPWPSMQHEHVEGEAPLGLLALELKPAPGPGPLHDYIRTLARCGPEAAVSSAAQGVEVSTGYNITPSSKPASA